MGTANNKATTTNKEGNPELFTLELSPAEYALIKKARNKRTKMYNLRVSEQEEARLVALENEIKKAGTELESRTDFIIHLVELGETILKAQTKLV